MKLAFLCRMLCVSKWLITAPQDTNTENLLSDPGCCRTWLNLIPEINLQSLPQCFVTMLCSVEGQDYFVDGNYVNQEVHTKFHIDSLSLLQLTVNRNKY
jgi:hypothetical protein